MYPQNAGGRLCFYGSLNPFLSTVWILDRCAIIFHTPAVPSPGLHAPEFIAALYDSVRFAEAVNEAQRQGHGFFFSVIRQQLIRRRSNLENVTRFPGWQQNIVAGAPWTWIRVHHQVRQCLEWSRGWKQDSLLSWNQELKTGLAWLPMSRFSGHPAEWRSLSWWYQLWCSMLAFTCIVSNSLTEAAAE